MTNEPIISVDHLTKRFNSHVVIDTITTSFSSHRITGLVGPDGAGKTTFLRLLAGLLLPSEGTIRVAGFDTVKDQQSLQEILGYMPQKFGLYEDLTVQQNLDLYADLRAVSKNDRPQLFAQLLSFTGLQPFTRRLAGALSGGMKQKLGLACALLSQPKVLLLDEPSVGVDPISRRELWTMVQNLVSEGVAVLWSTAYLDEAEKCDEVLLLHEGKSLFYGPPHQLTQTVDGRVFLLHGQQESKRALLAKMIAHPEVIDGVIQGDAVRIVLDNRVNASHFFTSLPEKGRIDIQPARSRFEDAFIDSLGGIPEKSSMIAQEIPPFPKTEKAVVEAIDLTKRFGDFTAVDSVSFQIKPGEIFGLLGPNGAGKTTTFKMLCGLLTPTEGEAYVTGLHLEKASGTARAHIGYMAQKFSLYGTLSTRQNLQFFSGIYNLRGSRRRGQIDRMIDIFKLEPFLEANAETLPLGFKQRLALSCALMHAPEVLFLDEPTSGVDPLTRREFWMHIQGLVERGVTVIVTTHFMDEAEYCDRIGLIYRSRLIEIGTPDRLKEATKTPENPSPTLEDAFIALIEQCDVKETDD